MQSAPLQVHKLQGLWRDTAAVRVHQRQLLFMQLHRFAERHAAKLVRTGAAFLSGASLSATSANATRKGTAACPLVDPRKLRKDKEKSMPPGVMMGSSPRNLKPMRSYLEGCDLQCISMLYEGYNWAHAVAHEYLSSCQEEEKAYKLQDVLLQRSMEFVISAQTDTVDTCTEHLTPPLEASLQHSPFAGEYLLAALVWFISWLTHPCVQSTKLNMTGSSNNIQ